MANCAKRLGESLVGKIVRRQELALASTLAGEAVIRNGRTVTVESVNVTARRAVIVDMQGARETVGFDDFFKERVVVVKPDLLLEPVKVEEVVPSWAGRYLFHRGERWKVLRVGRDPQLPESMVTLQSDQGTVEILTPEQLASGGWKVRRKATPTVSQRLAGVYKTLGEQLDEGRPWNEHDE